jgi:ribosomal protein S18 acetylase RimI-like enzyme
MNLPQLRLRRAVASDLDAILALERATDLAPHWPPSAYAAILAAPMGSSIEGNDPGAPFIPRSLRNGWETETHRCLFVAEMNEQIAAFAVGLLHPATHDLADLKQPDICNCKKQNCHSDPDPDPERSEGEGEGEGEESPHLTASSRIAELESVVVSASARRSGIGRALCRAVLDWCRTNGASEVVLEVRASSAAAVALYASLGFTTTARRPCYYQDPADDALLMRMEMQSNGGRIDD